MGGIYKASNEKLSNTRYGGDWRPSTSQVGLGLAGLGGIVYAGSKAYQAYDKYNFIKEAAAAMNSNSPASYLQMIPL
jgi:hypothetical protein